MKDKYGYYYVIIFIHLKNGVSPCFVEKRNPYTIKNIRLWCKLNNKPFQLISEVYEGSDIKLKWKCLKGGCNETFKMIWDSILQNRGCPYCEGRKVGLSNCLATKKPDLASEWHPTKNGDLTPYDVTCGIVKKVWWQCSKNLEHEWEAKINNRNSGNGCPYCSGRYATKENNLLVINPELCKEWNYKKNNKKPEGYTPGSNKKVWWICKECGYEWKSVIYSRNSGIGCPQCNESKGEIEIRKILNNEYLNYKSQYSFLNLLSDLNNPLRFDFAIFKDKTKTQIYGLIEYDGKQHYEWIEGWISKENYKKIKYHDQLKNQYCQKYNISLLRIPYWEFNNIENILNNWLKKVIK